MYTHVCTPVEINITEIIVVVKKIRLATFLNALYRREAWKAARLAVHLYVHSVASRCAVLSPNSTPYPSQRSGFSSLVESHVKCSRKQTFQHCYGICKSSLA